MLRPNQMLLSPAKLAFPSQVITALGFASSALSDCQGTSYFPLKFPTCEVKDSAYHIQTFNKCFLN